MRRLSVLHHTMVVLVSLLGVACLDQPRNGQEITDHFPKFSGYTEYPGARVRIDQWMYSTGSWYTGGVDRAEGSTEPFAVDAAGITWYPFSGNVRLSATREHWFPADPPLDDRSQRRIKTRIQAYEEKFTASRLTTLDAGQATQDCIDSQQIGFDIVTQCASPQSPVVELFKRCGRQNQGCCFHHNINEKVLCDQGWICDRPNDAYNGRCTVPAGGIGQPCNPAGNFCNAGGVCVAGTCRPGRIESLPILSLDLSLTTCDDAKWNSIVNSQPSTRINLGTDKDFYLDKVGNDFTNNATSVFGLNVLGVNKLDKTISKLGDIGDLKLIVSGRDICFKRLDLIANEGSSGRVFRKTFDPPYRFRATVQGQTTQTMVIPRDELHGQWTALDPQPHCDGPTVLNGNAIQRRITGALADALRRAEKNGTSLKGTLDKNGGFVNVTRLSSSKMKVKTKFTVTPDTPVGKVDAAVTSELELSFLCRPTGKSFDYTIPTRFRVPGGPTTVKLKENEIAIELGAVKVLNVDAGDYLNLVIGILNTGISIVNAVLDQSRLSLATGRIESINAIAIAESIVNKESASLKKALDQTIKKLPACPTLSLDTATPPNLTFAYPPVTISLPAPFPPMITITPTPADIDICQ